MYEVVLYASLQQSEQVLFIIPHVSRNCVMPFWIPFEFAVFLTHPVHSVACITCAPTYQTFTSVESTFIIHLFSLFWVEVVLCNKQCPDTLSDEQPDMIFFMS